MAEVSTIEIRIKSDKARRDVDRLRKSLKRVDTQAKKSQRNIQAFGRKLNASFTGVAKAAALAAASFAAFRVGAGLINTIRKFEDLKVVLKAVTGSSEAAERAFKLIQGVAVQGAISVDEFTQAFNILKSQGIEPTEQVLLNLANVSTATGKSITQIAEALTDASRGEFERLKELGIVIRKQGKTLEFTFQGVTKTINNSRDSILGAIDEIGRVNFAGAFAEGAKTITGIISNIGDQFDNLALEIGEGGLKDALKDVLGQFRDLTAVGNDTARQIGQGLATAVKGASQAFFFFLENIKLVGAALGALVIAKIAVGMVNLAKNVGLAVVAFRALSVAILANPIGIIAVAITGLVALFIDWVQVTSKAEGVTVSLGDVFSSLANIIKTILAPAVELVTGAFKAITSVISTVANATIGFFDSALESITGKANIITGTIETVGGAVRSFRDDVVDGAQKIAIAKEQEAAILQFAALEAANAIATVNAARDRELAKIAEVEAAQAKALAKQKELAETRTKILAALDKTIVGLQIEAQFLGLSSQAITAINAARSAGLPVLEGEIRSRDALIKGLQAEQAQRAFDGNFANYIRNLKEEVAVLRLNAGEREIALKLLRAEQQARATGANLTRQQREELRRLFIEQDRLLERNRREAEVIRKQASETNKLYKDQNTTLARQTNIFGRNAGAARDSANSIQGIFSQLIGNLFNRSGIGGGSGFGSIIGKLIGPILGGLFNGTTSTTQSASIGTNNANILQSIPAPSVVSSQQVSGRNSIGSVNLTVNNAQNLDERQLAATITTALSEQFVLIGD